MISPPRAQAFVGRNQELERFAACFKQARAGAPTFLLFEGEPGSGKTSLLDAIEASPLIRKGVGVGRIDVLEGEELDPVARAADALTHQKWYARVGGRRRITAVALKVLPDWISAIPVIGDVAEAIFVTVHAIRRRRKPADKVNIAEEIEELHRRARQRTIVLIIDDLQLAGETAIDRLFRLLNHARPGTRLLIVAAARTPRPGQTREPFRQLLDRLPAERVAHDRLDTLSYSALHQWMSAAYPDLPLPPSLIGFLLSETGGQPGAVLQLLERLLESGALQRSTEGWTYDRQIGDAQLSAAEGPEAQLGILKPAVAETVKVASIFGDEFDTLQLGQLLEIDELELEDRLAAAARFGVIAVAGEWTLPNGEISTRYRFVSSAARAALHRSLPASLRAELESRMLTA